MKMTDQERKIGQIGTKFAIVLFMILIGALSGYVAITVAALVVAVLYGFVGEAWKFHRASPYVAGIISRTCMIAVMGCAIVVAVNLLTVSATTPYLPILGMLTSFMICQYYIDKANMRIPETESPQEMPTE